MRGLDSCATSLPAPRLLLFSSSRPRSGQRKKYMEPKESPYEVSCPVAQVMARYISYDCSVSFGSTLATVGMDGPSAADMRLTAAFVLCRVACFAGRPLVAPSMRPTHVAARGLGCEGRWLIPQTRIGQVGDFSAPFPDGNTTDQVCKRCILRS